MREQWVSFIEPRDPYYNPNLTLDRHDSSLKIKKETSFWRGFPG